MRISCSETALALVLAVALCGCSKSGANGAGGAPASGQASVPAVAATGGSACDRNLITKADVAPLLADPVASEGPLAGDPQSCVFTSTTDSTVTIALRPGLGETQIKQTLSGATNQQATPMSGVGDHADWNPILREVEASKNNLLCDISVMGDFKSPATKEKIGALCTKIFSGT